MSGSLRIVRPQAENRQECQAPFGDSSKTTVVAPSLGELSNWKTWPPALAMVDQVIPFTVKTSGEFLALQRIVNHSLRRFSLFLDLSDHSTDASIIDLFVTQRVLFPTDDPEAYLLNLYGFLQVFLSCSWDRPLSMKRHEYNAKTLETIESDFHSLDFPLVELEIPEPKVSPRPDKPHTVQVNPYRFPDLTTNQVFEFIYRFWDVVLESDDDLMNLFVMTRLLELSVGRGQIAQFTTTADIIQYGQKGYSIGLPDLGPSEYVHRMIEQILDECTPQVFNVLHHQTNPYAYYVQFDPILKKHCRS